MDILILNWKDLKNPDVGGAEIILYELAKRLIRNGHTVTWFCRKFPGAKEEDSIDGINIIRRGNQLSVYWEAYRYYRSLQIKPDRVIDCINTICWQTPLYVPSDKRIMLVNQLAKEVFWYELPFPLSSIAYMLERIEYLTYKKTQVICYAQSTKKDLVAFGIPSSHIDIFSLGIDQSRYIAGTKAKNPLFVFVARLAHMKRPDLCVNAMKEVVATHPTAKLVIVGYGPMEQDLLKRIKDLHLENNISLIGKDALFFTKNAKDKKVWYMQQAWALLLPSVKEGWGMVVTEAAACGTMSIVTDVTGLRDSVKRDQTGLVISANPTAEELASAMRTVIEDTPLRTRLSKEAQKVAHTYTWESSYKQFQKYIGIL